MQITIDVPDNIVDVLANYASVQRTLTESADLVDLVESHGLDDTLDSRVANNIEELKEIGHALDSLHQIVRSALLDKEHTGEAQINRPKS